MHRRKTSKDEDANSFAFPPDKASKQGPAISTSPPATSANGDHLPSGHTENARPILGDSRSRVISTPSSMQASQSYPGSSSPYKNLYSMTRPPALNGSSNSHRHQPPAMRQSLSLPSNSHSRTRSVSGPFSPISPSPLSTSYSSQEIIPPTLRRSSSHGEYDGQPPNGITPLHPASSQGKPRRHARIHSRNLSVYFPRPGSLPSTTIVEDGVQEVEYPSIQSTDSVPMPTASPGRGQHGFREGFTFGGRPPAPSSTSTPHPIPPLTPSVSTGASRRGHHHKHSLSHNFFSFLEPGAQAQDELRTMQAPIPVSPWMPISPFPQSPPMDQDGVVLDEKAGAAARRKSPIGRVRADAEIAASAVSVAAWQFFLGAWVWIVGQQIGSLSCTGLGYWVVFDAFGVALGHIIPGYLARSSMQSVTKRPFGNSRMEALITFAQSVYLLFASVYVCKETVEHMLLSSGEGHHHHHGDEGSEMFGIQFPTLLLCTTLISLLTTTVAFSNHSKLVSTAGNHIPPLTLLLPSRYRYLTSSYSHPPQLANLLSNPYALSPLAFALSILAAAIIIPPHQHRPFDLVLAGVETIVTFSLAYSAAVALGAVLLQTSPARGLAGGRMEAFLRVMREIERHPLVLHLPAPHIWQLTPNLVRPRWHKTDTSHKESKAQDPTQSLVVTVELHVRWDLEDDEVLRLTRWAWERCVQALHFGTGMSDGGVAEAEVTVGIVRG
ncbi:hypothetical protein OBBRIDRAFT_877280 [Obba rivulosa]|uniref:Uncharacterized protein n=1 Tax=Obba rivulosa TaxID=1052685 RepID=A0A8E2ATU9_9APHY|nr:hypothetical protein OBBRIDRAFT_877280 [Obba rivulosa]